MGYINTDFEIFLADENNEWTKMIEGNVNNGESMNMNEIDFITVDKYGILFGKPFDVRLLEVNFFEHLLPGDIFDALIPARIPFKEETCIICVTNKPNILYTSCRHICICRSCYQLYPINKCPLCRRCAANKFLYQ